MEVRGIFAAIGKPSVNIDSAVSLHEALKAFMSRC